MLGRKLEADFHIIHGVATRIKNSVLRQGSRPGSAPDVVFNPLATAQVLLDQNPKGPAARSSSISAAARWITLSTWMAR